MVAPLTLIWALRALTPDRGAQFGKGHGVRIDPGQRELVGPDRIAETDGANLPFRAAGHVWVDRAAGRGGDPGERGDQQRERNAGRGMLGGPGGCGR